MCVVRVSKIINVHKSQDKASSAPKGTHSLETVQGRQWIPSLQPAFGACFRLERKVETSAHSSCFRSWGLGSVDGQLGADP